MGEISLIHKASSLRFPHSLVLLLLALMTLANPSFGQLHNPLQPGQLASTLKAPSFTTSEKFHYRVVQALGPRGIIGPAFGSALAQWKDSPHEWGQGSAGYSKRFASGVGSNLSRQTAAFLFEDLLHEDPRYFPSQEANVAGRIWSALRQTLYCKKDNGDPSLAYGRLTSAFAAGEFTSVWQPDSNNSVGHGMLRGGLTVSSDFAYNLLQEFVPATRPFTLRHHKQSSENGH